VVFDFGVTFKARKPTVTAFKFDRDDIELGIVMRASGLTVDHRSVNFFAMDDAHQ
jgi:hypothetical protein